MRAWLPAAPPKARPAGDHRARPPLRPSPLFTEWPDLVLEGPGIPRLLIELPIGFGDGRGAHQTVGVEVLERRLALLVGDALAHPFGVDARVDDEMRHVDVVGSELARDGLSDGAQAKLRARERGVTGAAAQTCGRAGEEDVAFAPRQHQARSLAASQEARITGHLPNLPEHALGGVEDGEGYVRADVENADLQRCMSVGIAQEGDNLRLLSRIEGPP